MILFKRRLSQAIHGPVELCEFDIPKRFWQAAEAAIRARQIPLVSLDWGVENALRVAFCSGGKLRMPFKVSPLM
jgi:hypothetical protein